MAARREAGFVVGIDAERIGRASMLLGAGRERLDTPIDYGAGILMRAGRSTGRGRATRWPSCCIGRHARLEEARALARRRLRSATPPPPSRPLVLG